MLLFLILFHAVVGPHPPVPDPSSGAVRAADYPAMAIRNRWEGKVSVNLVVNPKGRVSDCRIIQSSGHTMLDDTTCKIFVERARFEPARDESGNAVEGYSDLFRMAAELGVYRHAELVSASIFVKGGARRQHGP